MSNRLVSGGWTSNRTASAGGAGAVGRNAHPSAANATIAAAAVAACQRRDDGPDPALRSADPAAGSDTLSVIIQSSACRISRADCQRFSGSFSRHVATTRSMAFGVGGAMSLIGGGCSFRIDAIRLAPLFASNARLPVISSYRIRPNAKMSVRASVSVPWSCSGDMYCGVPRIVPAPVSGALTVIPFSGSGSIAFARPKSSSLTPVFVTSTFPGFRSR